MRAGAKVAMLVLGTLVAATPVMAQGPGGRAGGMGMGMRAMGPSVERLTELLSLDATQQARVKVLVEQFEADTKGERETLMANMQMMREGAVSMETVRAENATVMASLREKNDAFNTQVRGLLTPEQQKVLDQDIARQREQMQQMGGRRPPA